MAVITSSLPKRFPIVPSDVFGYEVNTDVGYGRESFVLTLTSGQTARVGTVLEVDYAAKTATLVEAPADAAAVEALGDLAVFVGRDIVAVSTAADFENLEATVTGLTVVGIVKGDGRGTLARGYLDFAGDAYYDLPADVKAALDAKFTKENRFKMQHQAI